MRLIRTIRCKLSVSESDIPVLHELFNRYAKAVTKIAQWGRDHKESNAIRLHHALYRAVRAESGLSANLVVTALRRASGMLKTAKLKGRFEVRASFVCLDEQTFTLKGESVSFSTHTGKRIKAALAIGDYQRMALAGQEPTSATLVRTHNGFFVNIVVKSEVENAAPGGTLGVDLGIRNVAVTSAGMRFDGKPIREFREDRWRIRASLQSNGTQGARKVLRRLSGYERRRMTHRNHEIAKSIVEEAVKSGCSLVRMEQLKGIRDRTRIPNRHRNRMMSLWAFFQLQEFVRYKAAARGIGFERINPAYTSQTCSACGKRGVRDRETFSCTTCDVTVDADVNAARNIAGGGVVTRPGIADQIVEFFSHDGQTKAPHFSAG